MSPESTMARPTRVTTNGCGLLQPAAARDGIRLIVQGRRSCQTPCAFVLDIVTSDIYVALARPCVRRATAPCGVRTPMHAPTREPADGP